MPITSRLLQQLNGAVEERRVREGIALLGRLNCKQIALSALGEVRASFLLCLAQWVDLGYESPHLIDELLQQLPPENRAKMPLRDFLMVRMADAFAAMAYEDTDRAIELLGFVLAAERELGSEHLSVLAHFWKGRAHRKKGEYQKASEDIVAARQLAQHLDLKKLAAAIQIQEAWLAFQRAEPKEAWSLLDQAEEQLRSTDDDISLGNISSARGRIVRRTGEYAESLAHYERAIKIFRRHNADHRNLARTLVNAAYVKRLLALNLRKQLDHRAGQPGAGSRASNGSGSLKRRYMAICHEALADLAEAGRIYALHQHHGGTGSVLVNGGQLHLELGDIERAAVEGAKAYDLAHSKHDLILMARARILEAYAENARVEEELGEDANIATHAHQARRYAEEAVQLALQTQNRRLLAGAHIVCGMVAASDFFREWEEARRCEMESAALLRSYDRDHLGEELAILKSKIMRSIGIDETLRAWSQGIVGHKTFQQMTEEFAEVVIPQVWLREGKKVSRVATRLSISPKKVRRVLRSVGLRSSAGRTQVEVPDFTAALPSPALPSQSVSRARTSKNRQPI
ncbi:MAG TPA: tetratricopeptide repeat protein [Acidobacteriaceae bacterium]